jgi:hypothetical protein
LVAAIVSASPSSRTVPTKRYHGALT